MGALHGGDVDVEAHLLVLRPERDLTASRGELVQVADGQDGRAFQRLEDGGKAVPFRIADEKNVAVAGVLDVREPLDDEPPAVDALAAEGLVEDGAEGILPEHTDDDRLGGAGVSLGRPVHEGREVIEVGGLDLVLGEHALGRLVSARSAAGRQEHSPQAQDQETAPGRRYHRRAIRPYTLRSTSTVPALPPPNSAW